MLNLRYEVVTISKIQHFFYRYFFRLGSTCIEPSHNNFGIFPNPNLESISNQVRIFFRVSKFVFY